MLPCLLRPRTTGAEGEIRRATWMELSYDLSSSSPSRNWVSGLGGDHSPIDVLKFVAFFRPQTPRPIERFSSAEFCS